MNADPGPIPAFLNRTKQKPLVGSYSLLNQYLNCPHATFHKYIAKTIPFIETPAMAEGNAIHLAMENRLRIKQPLPPKYAQWEPFVQPLDHLQPDAALEEFGRVLKITLATKVRIEDEETARRLAKG
jgi:hypothetical protein